MNLNIPASKKISPFLVFFLIHSMQIGIGILGFQRYLAKEAGYDAWISILLLSLAVHVIIWMIYKTLEIGGGDILSIHTYIFGKKLGKVFSSFFILYFCALAITVIRNYIEVVQVWMFTELRTFWFALVFLLLVIYIIKGGFRVVTGISLFAVILTGYIWFLFLFTIKYSDFTHLLPVLNHSPKEIFNSSKETALSFLGFETLLVFYPFIKKPRQSKKWSHIAISFSTILYLYLAIVTFAYFPEEQLQKNIWPTLTMWKIIELPFIERVEYIGIANWCLIILPNACISLWAASRILKLAYAVQQRFSVIGLSVICLICVCLIMTRNQTIYFSSIIGYIGFYLNFVYVPFLFFAVLFARKVKTK